MWASHYILKFIIITSKKAGFIYHPVLGWHAPSADKYTDRLVKIHYSEILEFAAWGVGWFFPDAKDYVKKKCAGTGSPSTSEWIGEINKPLPPTAVTLFKKSTYFGAYGSQNIYTFKDDHDNTLVWFTTTTLKKDINDAFSIIAKVKAHNTYKDEKQTIITRVKEFKAE